MESFVLAHELTRGLTTAYFAPAEDEVLGHGEVRSVAGHEVADEYPGLCAVFHVTSVDVQTADRLVTSQRPDVIPVRGRTERARSTQVSACSPERALWDQRGACVFLSDTSRTFEPCTHQSPL